MDPSQYLQYEDFSFVKFFGAVEHTVTLNKELWDREFYSNILEKEMKGFKCNECKERATVVDLKSKKFHCKKHSSLMDKYNDNLKSIDDILNELNKKLMRIEKMLVYVQERENYFKTNSKDKRITEEDEKQVAVLKKELSKKIAQLSNSIEVLVNNPKIDSYFKALDSYNELRNIVFELHKVFAGFLFEPTIDSITRVLPSDGNNVDSLEESKMSSKSIPVFEDAYQCRFKLMTLNYLYPPKVESFEADIHGLYRTAKDNHEEKNKCMKRFNEQVQKNIKLHIKNEELTEENKSLIVQNEKFTENTAERIQSIEKVLSNVIKTNVEYSLGMKNTKKTLPSLLDEILDKTDKFYSPKHFKLIDVIEKSLIELHREQNGKKIIAEQEFVQLKETLTDFLYILKDKHPSSIPEESKTEDKDGEEEKKEAKGDEDAKVKLCEFDVFYRVMGFMRDNNLKPSKGLREKYAQSNTTKILNEIPSFLDLNKAIDITRETYDRMKESYQSKPSFVYFFNSDMEIFTKTKTNWDGNKYIKIGYFEKGTDKRMGAEMVIYNNGCLDQGYYKDGLLEYFGRSFDSNGDFYIGGWRRYSKHGKGEYEYEDGSREVGCWVYNKEEGAFKFYDKEGKEEDRIYKEGELQ